MTALKTYLQNVQARLENATPGKWNAYDWPSFPKQDEYDSCVRIESDSKITAFCFSGKPNHDALLIANCPTDLSTLLQIVKIQNDALKKYSDSAFEIEGNIYKIGSVADKAIQQVEKLVSGGK